MSESIWTRERNLRNIEKRVLEKLRKTHQSLSTELLNDDWQAAAGSANRIMLEAVHMITIERELESVEELVDGFKRVQEGMELLEGKL